MVDPIAAVETLSLALALFFAASAIVSGAYCLWVYRGRKEDTLLLKRLVQRNVRVAAASAVILIYIVLARLNLSLGRPWGGLIITLAVIVLLYGPTSDAILWYRERREFGKTKQ